MYPFVRQQSDGTISAGSRRANENHDPSLIAQEAGSGRMGRSEGSREGREHLPADMRLDRELRMEQGMVVECKSRRVCAMVGGATARQVGLR